MTLLLVLLALTLVLAYALFGMLFALARLLWLLAPAACGIALALFIVGLALK